MVNMKILANHTARNTDNNRSEWTVHARCITKHPQYHVGSTNDDAATTTTNTTNTNTIPTIETVWEVSKTTKHRPQHYQQRIAIYAGPEHPHDSPPSKLLLMTMSLPSDTSIPPPPLLLLPISTSFSNATNESNESSLLLPSSSVLVWVHFRNNDEHRCGTENRPLHKVLCCLYNPNSLYIWDVFPNQNVEDASSTTDTISIPSEGWMITLPFDCRTIVPLNDENDNGNGGTSTGGLLLQRMPDTEDVLAYENSTTQHHVQTLKHNFNDYDDGFVLLGPPSTWQQKLQPPTSGPIATAHTDRIRQNTDTEINMDTALPTSSNHLLSPTTQQYQPQPPVISLFTLHHPLEDVIPVTVHDNTNHLSISTSGASAVDPATDAFEQVVWIGTAEWMNGRTDSGSHDVSITSQAQVMVTYHTMEHRHAIHVLTKAPPPPAIPPLHEQTRRQQQEQPPQQRKSPLNNVNKNYGPMRDIVDLSIDDDDEPNDDNDISNHLNMMIDTDDHDDDVPSDLFGRTNNTASGPPKSVFPPQPKMDHDIALADALGVTHPLGHRSRVSSSPRPQPPYLSMSGGGNHHHHPPLHYRTKAPTIVMQDHASHSGFFSPSYGTSGTSNNRPTPMNMDISHHTTATVASAPNIIPSSTHQPPSSSSNGFFDTKLMNALHPRIAIQCLYKESSLASAAIIPCAKSVCLISNLTATGTLVLAILRLDNTLTMYTLIPGPVQDDSNQKFLNLEVIKEIQLLSCIRSVVSIAPICAFPTPLRNTNHIKMLLYHKRRYSVWKTTDLLLLLQNQVHCTLYRSNIPICECQISNTEGIDTTSIKLVGLSDPVFNTYSLYFENTGMENGHVMARCQLSLELQKQSSITERVLSCLDATMYGTDAWMNIRCIQMALKIRTDYHRFLDAIAQVQLSQTLPTPERLQFDILQFVIVQVLQYHLTGTVSELASTIPSKSLLAHTKGSSDWEALLASDFHQSYAPGLKFHSSASTSSIRNTISTIQNIQSSIGSIALQDIKDNKSWRELPLFSLVFDSMHLLYEDTKLSAACSSVELASLSGLLIQLASMVQQLGDDSQSKIPNEFLNYYRDENEFVNEDKQVQNASFDSTKSLNQTYSRLKWTCFTTPPSIFNWTQRVLKNLGGVHAGNFGAYGNIADWHNINPLCTKTRLVLRLYPLLSTGSSTHLHIVQALLEEGFTDKSMIRDEFCSGISLPILEVLYQCRNTAESADVPGWSSEAWILVGRRDLAMNANLCQAAMCAESNAPLTAPDTDDAVDESCDGLADIERSATIIFPEDNRVHEAARLLCSSRPIFLRVARAVEVSDHDFERLKQKRLLILSCRALALPTGRGMLTIGRFRPLATETLPIPALCLKGRVPPTNSAIMLDTSDCPTDMHVWPEFHNGASAGLRLPVKGDPYFSDFTIPRTWILYNRPPLSRTPAPTPQDSGDETTSTAQTQSYSHGGFLLALGLRGHLAALDMSDVYEYLTQGCATTTVGVLLGMAANKRGSCDLSVSKMLCLHIPSLIPQHFSAIDVASIVQTSAIVAAGLLFQGSSHRMMTEFLLNEIGKRPDADINTSDRESYTLACGLALGTVNLCLGESIGTDSRRLGLADLHIEERLIRYIIGGIDRDEGGRTRESNDRFSLPNSMVGSDNEKCSTIYESNLINTSVTSPGATLALGLMYMKTNNKAVAESLNLPDTHFLLEFVRPDFLGYRVMSKALILWDEVKASRKWVDEQIPLVVRDAYEQIGVAAKAAYSSRWPTSIRNHVEEYDRRAVKQIYIHVVSSACFAMGLRFAGTANADAKEVIMGRVMELHGLREATDPVSLALRPEISILESCLGCAAIALAMVVSGTGDLDALRLFKILRWRCDNDSQYGIHMTFGMCVGLLFLGGGTCTLGRDPADIAALVTAFFPRFPVSTSDNQYHLQALRHLYALAVKRTELKAIDVDTNENVQVSIKISLSDKSIDQHEVQVPCLLRNSGSPHQELRVLSDNFFPRKLDLLKQNGIYSFFVQRRYTDQRKSLATCSSSSNAVASVLMGTSNVHPYLKAYADYFLTGDKGSSEHHALDHDFLSHLISTCQKSDCPEDVLPLYLKIWYGLGQLKNMDQTTRACFLWDLRLLQCYYLNAQTRSETSLLDKIFLLPYIFECTERLVVSTSSQSFASATM